MVEASRELLVVRFLGQGRFLIILCDGYWGLVREVTLLIFEKGVGEEQEVDHDWDIKHQVVAH